jgi:Delta24(24(1))-sterol reductase
MSFTWGLIVGRCSPIPYFYSVFFITVLIHRCGRDFERYVAHAHCSADCVSDSILPPRCAHKYGKDWERYCKIVPYKFIPYVY